MQVAYDLITAKYANNLFRSEIKLFLKDLSNYAYYTYLYNFVLFFFILICNDLVNSKNNFYNKIKKEKKNEKRFYFN